MQSMFMNAQATGTRTVNPDQDKNIWAGWILMEYSSPKNANFLCRFGKSKL